jgi:hypothetical protein
MAPSTSRSARTQPLFHPEAVFAHEHVETQVIKDAVRL